jgi:hypothetical protein
VYRINLDVINKIIYIEASGSISLENIKKAVVELRNLIDKLDQGQYSMLFLEQRLDPFSQDSLPAMKKALELVLGWAKKIAVVSGNRTVTKMQVKRIEAEVRKEVNVSIPIMRFQTINEAMNYINH